MSVFVVVLIFVAAVLTWSCDAFGVPTSPLDFRKSFVTSGLQISKGLVGAALVASLDKSPALAEELKDQVVVLGSNGKTGKLIVDLLAKSGEKVLPTYARTPPSMDSKSANVLKAAVADVTDQSSLTASLTGAKAVIFAASASKKGGSAEKVDFIGVENVARECVRLKIPRLVVISSGAITRPDSLGFKITNLFGNIMNYKLQGEDALRSTYEEANLGSSCSYAIIRPGGLLDGTASGAAGIELNQGDTISGEVNRADVAECAVNAAVSNTLPASVTFEMYKASSGGPLEGKLPKKSGFEKLGSSYEELFKGLKSNYNRA